VELTYLGGQKIGEADCNDVCLWCHLRWRTRANKKEAKGTWRYCRWIRAIQCFLLHGKSKEWDN